LREFLQNLVGLKSSPLFQGGTRGGYPPLNQDLVRIPSDPPEVPPRSRGDMLQATSQSLQTFPPVEGNSHPRWCRAPARTAPAWILFLVALAGPFPMFGAAILDDHSEQANVLEEGKKRIEERRFPEAIAAFGRLKQMAPLDPRAYFLSGIALAESGHLSAAA